jgi:peptidoglycan/xylan/chitin deacetylase (PgdA/CDA1 family)
MKPFSLTAMMYHYVRDPGDACERGSGIAGLPVARFEAQLEDLRRRYDVVSWPDVRAFVLEGRALPPRACLLTFDDGTGDHYRNVFPALRARNLSGLFFAMARRPGDGLALGHQIHFLLARLGVQGLREAVWARLSPTQQAAYRQAEERYRPVVFAKYGEGAEVDLLKFVLQRDLSLEAHGVLSRLIEEHVGPEAEVADDLYLAQAQIAEMAAGGMHFGGHSRTHPWFNWVSAESQAEEIDASAAWLSEVEAGPWAFAYPYGGIGAESPALLRERGFAAAFTTVERVEHDDPYLIGRLDGEAEKT